ncbi:hypothetical protein ACHAXA_000387 [Cyclostephanos tholiformis]|uniref:BTB domain-containing protein n=1 Tax=Cyclostephanos tholiformis TaxID=382380 RepID=A0ABD3RJC1_9STRA
MVSFAASSSKHPRFDIIIGLDVAGKLFYCRKSTLLGDGTSYFAARFGPDSMMDPQRDHIADNGREIYFIDRNPEVFKYVLEYLRTLQLPPEIGTFQENPNLWRALRVEAEFYCLGGLISLLKATYSCSPETDGGKGVLHWLGTKKGKDAYENPYHSGAVDVTGWFDSFDALGEVDPGWGSYEKKTLLVEYRPMPRPQLRSSDIFMPGEGNVIFPCLAGYHSNQRLPVVVDMRGNVVSPSHYSLRYGACRGLDGNWNFEGSTDGEHWVLLHAGTNDGHKLSLQRITERQRAIELSWINNTLIRINGPENNWRSAYCDYMERHYRHTWEINNSSEQYFRYFRIIGADPVDGEARSLHFIGLEIYGHVYER